MEPLERKLATILAADVAGYSRLMAENEELTLRTFQEHRRVFESLVSMHRGRVFNTAGDAILAEFGSVVEAVRCATEIQSAMRTLNDKLSASRQIHFRIGVNLGDVLPQGSDLLGDGVNVAARLQTAAEPGGVCISGSVFDQIQNKLALSMSPLGERSYKNIPQPIRTFSITQTEAGEALPHAAGISRVRKLPFAKLALAVVAGASVFAVVALVRKFGPVAMEGEFCAFGGEARRCLPAHGNLAGTKLTGTWDAGPNRELKAFLDGDASANGELMARVRVETASGALISAAELTGIARDGRVDASGTLRNGGPASLHLSRSAQ